MSNPKVNPLLVQAAVEQHMVKQFLKTVSICAWCEPKSVFASNISHGICEFHAQEFLKELRLNVTKKENEP